MSIHSDEINKVCYDEYALFLKYEKINVFTLQRFSTLINFIQSIPLLSLKGIYLSIKNNFLFLLKQSTISNHLIIKNNVDKIINLNQDDRKYKISDVLICKIQRRRNNPSLKLILYKTAVTIFVLFSRKRKEIEKGCFAARRPLVFPTTNSTTHCLPIKGGILCYLRSEELLRIFLKSQQHKPMHQYLL